MNTFNDINKTSKLSTPTWLTASVDLITDEWIYIWFRWQSLKQFDRLYFRKDVVDNFFEEWIWSLIDWRVKASLEEMRQHIGNLFIIWVDKEIDINDLFNTNSDIEYVYDIVSWQPRKVLWTEIIDNVKYLYLTPVLGQRMSPTETAIKLKYKFDDIKKEISATAANKMTLDEIAKKHYSVTDATFLHITDMPDAN